MLATITRAPLRSDEVTQDAQYFEYTTSANPIGAGLIPRVPYWSFGAPDHGPTGVTAIDLSSQLKCEWPATGPSLLANFVRILAGEEVMLNPNASSQAFYVLDGAGTVEQKTAFFSFAKGDFFALPGGAEAVLKAQATARLYYVHDAPLFAYLGATVGKPRFSPTLYPAERAHQELMKAAHAPNAARRNRVSILLGNANFPQTRTITHTLWDMYGIVPPGAVQKPHRHQSIALDFVPECKPGSYTLVGTKLDDKGNIVNPLRVDWKSGMMFITPPGYWHSHHNESDADCYVIPFQDAGLHTYLCTLDIHFSSGLESH